MKRIQLIIFNIIIFLYQFEFIPIEKSNFILSFYRIGIFPLLIILLTIENKKLLKKDISKYFVVLLFFSFTIISVIGYGYYSNLITIIGNLIQSIVAYFYFRENKIEKSTLYVITTWGLFQLPYFIIDLLSGNLGLSHRFIGFHWDPNYLCMSLMISFWAKIYLLRSDVSKYLKITILFLAFMDVLMILFTLSRGGILALLITGILYTFFYHRKVFYVLSIGCIFLISYMIERSRWVTWSDSLSLMDLIIYRTFVTAQTSDISAGRIDLIENYIDMLNKGEGVIFGIPIDYYIQNMNGGVYPHNSIIEILLQGGVVAGGIFYLFFIYQIIKIIFFAFKNKILIYEILFLTSGLGVLMFLTFGLKIAWLFVGLVFAISNKKIFEHNYVYPCMGKLSKN